MGESGSERQEKSARLRRVLARYRGGRFETAGSGGAGGMMFFRTAEGQQFYIGGFNPDRADDLATALNLVLDLLERGSERPSSCTSSPREKAR